MDIILNITKIIGEYQRFKKNYNIVGIKNSTVVHIIQRSHAGQDLKVGHILIITWIEYKLKYICKKILRFINHY